MVCSLFMRFRKLPPVKLCLCRAFVYGFRTYLQGTVGMECSLNVFVQNLHSGEHLLGVHPVFFLQGTVGQGL